MKIVKLIDAVLSIPKTIRVNFSLLPKNQAIHFPILVNWKTKIDGLNGKVTVDAIKTGMTRIGFGGSFALGGGNETYLKIDGDLILRRTCTIGRGTQLIVSTGSELKIGKDVHINANCLVHTSHKICIDDYCLIGWDTTIMGSDGHTIIRKEKSNKPSDIILEKHVWVCSGVKILKGSKIRENSIVAANAMITKEFQKGALLIGGTNCVLDKDVAWER